MQIQRCSDHTRSTIKQCHLRVECITGFGLRACLQLALVAFVTAAVTVAQADQLRLSPSEGDKLHLVYDQATTQLTEVEGKSISMTFEMGMEMDWQIESVADDGSFTVAMRFTRFRISMESQEVDPIQFDSASEERVSGYYAESLQKVLQPFLDNDVEVVVTSRGEITSVVIPIETMDAIREVPGSMQIRQLLTQEGITETLSGTLCPLPEDEVELDESWTVNLEKELQNGKLFQEHTYVYQGEEEVDGVTLQRISVGTDLQFEQPEDAVQQPQTIKSQTLEGVIWINPDTGFFAGSEFVSELITEMPYRDATIETIAEGSYKLQVTKVE